MFNNSIINITSTHKQLGMILDSKLSLDKHLRSVLDKISKTTGLLRKFQGILLEHTYDHKFHKSFARPHLDHGDVIYDQTCHEFFHQRLDSIQHYAAIATTRTIRGTSSEKLYQE